MGSGVVLCAETIAVIRREEQNFAVAAFLQNRVHAGFGVAPKQAGICYHQVGLMLQHIPQTIGRIRSLAYDLDVGFIFEQTTNPLAQQYVVMYENAGDLLILLDV